MRGYIISLFVSSLELGVWYRKGFPARTSTMNPLPLPHPTPLGRTRTGHTIFGHYLDKVPPALLWCPDLPPALKYLTSTLPCATPGQNQGKVPLPPLRQGMQQTGYGAGGTPLAFSRIRTFLFILFWRTQVFSWATDTPVLDFW